MYNVPQTFHCMQHDSHSSVDRNQVATMLLTDRLAMVRCMGMVEKFTGKAAPYAFTSERQDSRFCLENFSRAKRTLET